MTAEFEIIANAMVGALNAAARCLERRAEDHMKSDNQILAKEAKDCAYEVLIIAEKFTRSKS